MKILEEICERLESWTSVGVSAVLLATSFLGMTLNIPWLEQTAWGSVILSGLPLAWGALIALCVERRITSALLITIAIVASIIIGEIFAAGEIAFIMAIGELLEHGTVSRARRGLERLLTLTPPQGRRICEGREEMIASTSILAGDLLRVAPGERIPTDGVIENGSTSIDQSLLTGESLPVERTVGENVYAGTLNGDGSIDLRATSDGGDSTLQQMIRLVKEAGQKQAPIQREADRWARWIVPISITTALIGYIVLRVLGYEQGEAMLRAVTVLVVFCPCALALATPTCIMAAIGQATKHGVVVKSGEALEVLGRVDTLAFDKTGTLTMGQPVVTTVRSFDMPENNLLALAAALESRSEHPLGRAVVSAADKLQKKNVSDFRALPGRGVRGRIDGHDILCGSESCLAATGIVIGEQAQAILNQLRTQGMATILLAEDHRLRGIIGLQDTMRPDTPETLSQLKTMRTILLTGDNLRAARNFANPLKITEIHADLMPSEKSAIIEELQKKGHCVAMVGDGVNDAPALKKASIGIAMSHLGADIATEAADVSLLHDDLSRLPYLIALSRTTLRNIRFNIAAALIINLVAVTLSLLGLLTPISGALVHNAGSLIVILNAALLYDRKVRI